MRVYIYLIILFAFSASVMASPCRPTIQISLLDMSASPEEEVRLKNLINDVMAGMDTAGTIDKTNESPATICDASDRILLTNIPLAYSDQYVSEFELPAPPQFLLYQRNENTDAPNVVVQRSRPYSYAYTRNTYPVDDDSRTIGLLEKGRVDGVIDYAANAPIYQSRLDALTITPLNNPLPISIVFSDASRQTRFDQTLAEQKQLKSSIAFSPKASLSEGLTQITWLVLKKFFSAEKDSLVPLEEELAAARWLSKQLPLYELNVEAMSTALATERLQENDNVCLAGVFKSEKRKAYAVFSEHYFYYLYPRLYFLNDSRTAQRLNAFIDEEGAIDPLQVFSTLQDLSVGFAPGIAQQQPEFDALLQTPAERFVSIEAFERERLLQLLTKNRIDSIIEFPTNVKQLITSEPENAQLVSVPFSPIKPPIPTYVACSKSELGRAVVQELNAVFTTPKSKAEYIEVITQGLTDSAAAAIRRATDTYNVQN